MNIKQGIRVIGTERFPWPLRVLCNTYIYTFFDTTYWWHVGLEPVPGAGKPGAPLKGNHWNPNVTNIY